MNMLLGFISRAIAGTAKNTATGGVEPQRLEFGRTVRIVDGRRRVFQTGEVFLCSSRKSFKDKRKERPSEHRLKSRGKGGKTAHSFSGVRAVKRAAAKRRNKKG